MSELEALARAVRTIGDRAGPVNQALEASKLRALRLSAAVPRMASTGQAAGSLSNAATACEQASRNLHAFGDGCRSFADRLVRGSGGTGAGGVGGGGGAGGGGGVGGEEGGPKGFEAPARSFSQDDRSGADEWARAAGIHAGDLQGQQLDAVRAYTGTDYHEVNPGLRSQPDGVPAELTDQCRAIDASMKPLPEDIQLIRGTGRSWLPPEYQGDPEDTVGQAFLDRGYLSATARGYDEKPGLNAEGDRLLMRVPAGKKALYVDPISLHRGEDEILLSRDTVLYVHNAEQRGNQWFFEVEVVSRAWAEAMQVLVHR